MVTALPLVNSDDQQIPRLRESNSLVQYKPIRRQRMQSLVIYQLEYCAFWVSAPFQHYPVEMSFSSTTAFNAYFKHTFNKPGQLWTRLLVANGSKRAPTCLLNELTPHECQSTVFDSTNKHAEAVTVAEGFANEKAEAVTVAEGVAREQAEAVTVVKGLAWENVVDYSATNPKKQASRSSNCSRRLCIAVRNGIDLNVNRAQ